MLFMYVLGAQIDYSPVNWERCCVIEGWLQAYTSSESPVTEETQLQSIWFNGGWQRARRLGGGGYGRYKGWGLADIACKGRGMGVADRYKDKGRLSKQEFSWKMAGSFLVQEKGSHWSKGDAVPSWCPSWSWHPLSPKGHPPFTPPTFPTNWLSLTDIFFCAARFA